MSNNKIRYSPDIRQEYSSDDDVERGRARLYPPSWGGDNMTDETHFGITSLG
jgi:hypothetical protein